NAKITGTITRTEGPYASENMSLDKGRYYVDGLLVENESKIDVAQPSKNGLHLAYLDVWTRHICAAEDNTLLEPALGGPDTTSRIKTAWQLRCRYLGAKDAFTPDEIRKRYYGVWPELSSPEPSDYWQLPLGTGRMKIDSTNFTRIENQLYRVEVHTGNFDENGEATTLKFKWSRDNGSVVAAVKDINTTTKIITLADADLKIQNAFGDANLIEICDEVCSRTGAPGYLVSVDMSLIREGKINLKENWGYERSAAALEAPIIVRRWDGVQSVKNFELEDGLTVAFDADDVYYRSGDYWLIPTRTDAVIGWENNVSQPAHGVEHHFAALALITKETNKCTFENLGVIFQPLTKGNVSKAGDTINGDLAVLGRLSVGSSIFNAPLSINADAGGKLMSLKASDETWRVNQGSEDTPSLRITDNDGNGLTLKKGGNVGIGTADPKFKLDVKADKWIKLGLEGMGGGQLQIGCNPNDNKIFLEAFNSTGDGHAAEFLLTGRNAQNVPKLSLCADTTYIKGNVGIGTNSPADKLDIAGGSLRVSYDNDHIEIDPWVGSNGSAISFHESGQQKANLYWNKGNQIFHVNSAGGSNTCLNLNGGNVGIGIMPQYKLDVNGSINVTQDIRCARWKVTRVLRQAAGPLTGNGLLGNFTSSGGMLLVYAFGSGFSRTAGRTIGMQINVDDMMMGSASIFANEASSHKSFVGTSIMITSIGAGNHTLKLYNLNLDSQTDANDIFDVTVMELPFR
ncbi:MAG: hypothetical protein HGA29_05880, partial [Syntrophaceae bacterium]|nr:hypothetical protein [Syntrophaceae bacterium]